MKITYLSESILPSRWANSVHVFKVCEALGASGHDVSLVAFRNPWDWASRQEIFRQYGSAMTFSLKLLPFLAKGRLLRILAGLISGLVGREKSVQLVFARSIAAAWTSQRGGVPLVIEIHHLGFMSSALERMLFASLLRGGKLDAIVVITSALRTDLLKSWPEATEITHVIADAASGIQQIEKSEENPDRADTGLRIGYVGQLHPGKGVELILKIAELLPNDHFHVFGGTQREIQGMFERNHVPSNLEFHGQIPHAEVNGVLLELDITLVPNQLSVVVGREKVDIGGWTSPLKLFEYMAAGRAIVCSDLEVLREIVSHGENAILCDPTSPRDWADAIDSLRDSNKRAELGQAARNLWEEKYSWPARAAKMIGLICR